MGRSSVVVGPVSCQEGTDYPSKLQGQNQSEPNPNEVYPTSTDPETREN